MSRSNTRQPSSVSWKLRFEQACSTGSQWAMPLFSVVVLVAMGVLLNDWFRVTQWEVQAEPVLKDQIQQVLKSTDDGLSRRDFIHSSPSQIQQLLLNRIPDIASADVRRQLPNRLLIVAQEKQSIALWQKSSESIYLVDERGTPYREVRPFESFDLPLLRIRKDELVGAARLMVALKQMPEWYAKASEVFAEFSGWKINFHEQQQWRLPFGQGAEDDLKQLARMLKKTDWSKQAWRINTRMGERWFFRPARQGGLV